MQLDWLVPVEVNEPRGGIPQDAMSFLCQSGRLRRPVRAHQSGLGFAGPGLDAMAADPAALRVSLLRLPMDENSIAEPHLDSDHGPFGNYRTAGKSPDGEYTDVQRPRLPVRNNLRDR